MRVLLTLLLTCVGCINIPESIFQPDRPRIVELERGSGSGRKTIAIVDIEGTITGGSGGSGFFGSSSTVVEMERKLALVESDEDIAVVILRINSPGGDVTASDQIYNALLRFKQRTGRRVYASMQGTAASGGYYVAMAADEIYAHPTTVTGSIGVIATFPQLDEMLEKIGVSFAVIKSGARKDIGSMTRPITDEEYEILEGLIDNFYNRFLDVVNSGRPKLSMDQVRELADGRVFTASQAAESGLVDGIADLHEVIAKAKTHTGGDPDVILVSPGLAEYETSAHAQAPVHPAPREGGLEFSLLNVKGSTAIFQPPRFSYLWIGR